ncbi:phosphatase domain-containing protein [Streptomyces sp. NBC_01304]|uniref:phosphatase domain-containing protein n=1 Tax=Streptomyces sp. NBC_01304 TaxID=2903818 RepID=UPI002E11854E|nr:AAA family ATPase [Streptomyces sp. NBC_01304]
MPTLHFTRGLPASGKTTWARAWTAEDRAGRARVNRDDLRAMLDSGEHVKGVTEKRVMAVRDAAILKLLRQGHDVVCDDTNLPQRVARDLARLADRAGAELEVHDFTDVPLETCLERDAARAASVGEDTIRDLHLRYLAGKAFPLPLPDESREAAPVGRTYEPKPDTPKAVLVDIDGTVALMTGRSPFDETRVHEDVPNPPVVQVVRALHAAGNRIVFLSGRTDDCREATEAWLTEHVGVPYTGPFMRPSGDSRKDSLVKVELFDAHVRDAYDVTCVLDDRNQVVQAWRAIGLTVLQVADGDF